MNDVTSKPATREIVIDKVFPHAPEKIWRALTDATLIGRWLMAPTGFAATKGTEFTFQTKAAGAWDGVIRCQVLEVVANERLVYSWQSGHAGNIGYGAPLDTVVTWTLSAAANGTRVRIIHSGFVLPKNDTAYSNMGEGWKKVVRNLDALVGEPALSKHLN
ncbi:MAG: SRPBCC domain-containing protein [Magnetospirillum sp.]|nr:SRPBCC domain-containing protein [Magnetospirillum sp.]